MGQEFVGIVSIVILMAIGVILGYVLSQLILGYLTLNLVTFLGTISLIIIFGTLYFVLFWEFKKRQSHSFSPQPSYPTPETHSRCTFAKSTFCFGWWRQGYCKPLSRTTKAKSSRYVRKLVLAKGDRRLRKGQGALK